MNEQRRIVLKVTMTASRDCLPVRFIKQGEGMQGIWRRFRERTGFRQKIPDVYGMRSEREKNSGSSKKKQ